MTLESILREKWRTTGYTGSKTFGKGQNENIYIKHEEMKYYIKNGTVGDLDMRGELNVTNLRHLIKVKQNGTTPGDPVC